MAEGPIELQIDFLTPIINALGGGSSEGGSSDSGSGA